MRNSEKEDTKCKTKEVQKLSSKEPGCVKFLLEFSGNNKASFQLLFLIFYVSVRLTFTTFCALFNK